MHEKSSLFAVTHAASCPRFCRGQRSEGLSLTSAEAPRLEIAQPDAPGDLHEADVRRPGEPSACAPSRALRYRCGTVPHCSLDSNSWPLGLGTDTRFCVITVRMILRFYHDSAGNIHVAPMRTLCDRRPGLGCDRRTLRTLAANGSAEATFLSVYEGLGSGWPMPQAGCTAGLHTASPKERSLIVSCLMQVEARLSALEAGGSVEPIPGRCDPECVQQRGFTRATSLNAG